jgi:CheY-like chemotaxis protein
MNSSATKESFVHDLANTLSHLYDPGVLRRSLWLPLFGFDQKSNPVSALQNVLAGAIKALKPGQSVPHGTSAWHIYHVLYYRYVEQIHQSQVANDLGLSVRQLRRKEKAAVQVLADYLWSQYNLDENLASADSAARSPRRGVEPGPSATSGTPSQEEELQWLQKTVRSELVDLRGLTEGITETIRPLARTLGVSVACTVPEDCPRLNVQLTMIRQAILYVATTAVRFTPQGQVEIDAEALTGREGVRIQIRARRGAASLVDAQRGKELEFARKLLQMSRGVLETAIDPAASTPFVASITLPAAPQVPILVIDDNPDLLGLVQRYLSDTRYEFHGTTDSQTALAVAEDLAPEIILLDVMLAGVDGWELLGRLRAHPKTQRASIVICTILPQEQLALTLGATDFIRKPIRRKDLLAVLDRQIRQPSRDAPSFG